MEHKFNPAIDYYAILGLSPQAEESVIKAAYRALSQKYHPDKNDGDGLKMQEINEAYSVLSTETSRKAYDEARNRFHNINQEDESPPDNQKNNEDERAQKEATSWSRFLARTFDLWLEEILLVLIFVGIALLAQSVIDIEKLDFPGHALVLLVLSLPVCLILDAIVYMFCGNTPGKALLGIKVYGPKLSSLNFSQYLARNFRLWASGYALGLPIVNLFTMGSQYKRINKGLSTSYDEPYDYVVLATTTGWIRKTFFWMILFFFYILVVVIPRVLEKVEDQRINVHQDQQDEIQNEASNNAIKYVDEGGGGKRIKEGVDVEIARDENSKNHQKYITEEEFLRLGADKTKDQANPFDQFDEEEFLGRGAEKPSGRSQPNEIKENYNSPERRSERIKVLFNNKDYLGVVREAEAGDYLSESSNIIGLSLLNIKQASRAIAVFKDAEMVTPDSGIVKCNTGDAYLNTGDISMALTKYAEALNLDPDNDSFKKRISYIENNINFKLHGYKYEYVTVEFIKLNTKDAFNFIGQVIGRKIVYKGDSSKTTTLKFTDIPVDLLFSVVLNMNNLESTNGEKAIYINDKK